VPDAQDRDVAGVNFVDHQVRRVPNEPLSLTFALAGTADIGIVAQLARGLDDAPGNMARCLLISA
jgi:hypothetical protein